MYKEYVNLVCMSNIIENFIDDFESYDTIKGYKSTLNEYFKIINKKPINHI
jgi:hypothetical protein